MNAFSTPTPKRRDIKNPKIPRSNLKDFNPDLVIFNANQIITMDSEFGVPRIGEQMKDLGIIRKGAIAIQNGIIVHVGSYNDLESKCRLTDETILIDASNQIVAPGFVDPHTHIIFDGSREEELSMKIEGKSYLEILESGGGILKTVRATRIASIDKLVSNGKKILDRMITYGTTTIETKSGYGLDVENEIKSLIVAQKLNNEHIIDVVPTFLGAHAIPPEFEAKPEEYVKLITKEMIPRVAEEKLAEFCDVFCEEGIFSIEQTRTILESAILYGLKPQIHIDEIVDTGGAALAAELNAIQVGHLLKSNDEGLKALGKKKIVATLLPGTPFCLMQNEYAPARKMIEYGIPIALSTDLNPNCWTESMQMIIALACYKMKMMPAEALTASTLNAACAIQRQNEIGSIEFGKKADIIIFDIPNYEFLPYHFGVNLISKVIKNGKIVVDRRT